MTQSKIVIPSKRRLQTLYAVSLPTSKRLHNGLDFPVCSIAMITRTFLHGFGSFIPRTGLGIEFIGNPHNGVGRPASYSCQER